MPKCPSRVTYALVMAHDRDFVVGVNNKLPWNCKSELNHFRRLTLGHPIIMGSRTAYSLVKPLGGRFNVVLTHSESTKSELERVGFTVCKNLNEVQTKILTNTTFETEVVKAFVIGGPSLWKAYEDKIDELHISRLEVNSTDSECNQDTETDNYYHYFDIFTRYKDFDKRFDLVQNVLHRKDTLTEGTFIPWQYSRFHRVR